MLSSTRSTRLLGAVSAGLGLTLLTSAPAFAHDELVGTTPASSGKVTGAPEQVVLRFSEPPGPIGTTVTVKDASGTDWAAGKPVRTGSTVNVPLRQGAKDGSYSVAWRVVSDDGHPVSGTFGYSVTGAAKTSPSSSSVSTPDGSSSAQPAARPDAAQTNRDSKVLTGVLAVFLVAVLAGIGALLMRRQRR